MALTDPAWPLSCSPEHAGTTQRRLLQSIVEVARSVYGAAAASVFLRERETGDLVFEAVAGEGREFLPGTRFPDGTGIVGWTAAFGQPLVIDDVSGSPQFAREAAEATGYIPRSIMAAPLLRDGDCIGVLEILDRGTRQRCDLSDLDSLGLLATEIATVLELLVHVRLAGGGGPQGAPPDMPLLRRVAERLPAAPEQVGATVTRLLIMADELLASAGARPDVISA
jgi:putative methionine-R-sulfoxide reductase with GAF domain